MEKIYFTSDLHLNHDKEFLYKTRGFDSVEDMNEFIIEKWNETVKDEDLVYILGDIMLGDSEKGIELFKSLNGKKSLILGNHDTASRVKLYKQCDNVIDIRYADMIKIDKKSIYISHYPSITTNFDDEIRGQHIFNFYGHTHQTTNFYENNPFIYHVGMDSHDCQVVEFDEIIRDCQKQYNIKRELDKMNELR